MRRMRMMIKILGLRLLRDEEWELLWLGLMRDFIDEREREKKKRRVFVLMVVVVERRRKEEEGMWESYGGGKIYKEGWDVGRERDREINFIELILIVDI